VKKSKPQRQSKSRLVEVSDRSLRAFVGYNMKRSYMTIQHDLLKCLEDFELRLSTFSALLLICDNPDMTQSQLALALNVERSGVVLLVDELESRDLISRNKVPTDRRSYALRATLAGMRLRDKAHARICAHEDALMNGLTETERAQLLQMLNKIERSAADD
jgi:DNA-binding MarR family transcriptional regulator